MDNSYTLGIYNYKLKFKYDYYKNLPKELDIKKHSPICILLELIMGNVVISNHDNKILYNESTDYTKLPMCKKGRSLYKQFETVLGIDEFDEEKIRICDKFFVRERKNTFVYQQVLNELSNFFVCHKYSPCEGFIHLYRSLEFLSYSFPLVYTSHSKSFKGSYTSLKKFFNDDNKNISELEFFENFLKELYKNYDMEYKFPFEILVRGSKVENLKREFCKCIDGNYYVFENNTLVIEFQNIRKIFNDLRNKYFHMSIGQKQKNFLCLDYNKNDLFYSLNPIFVNWISCIFVKIVQHGISEYDN